jgi:hypothetical protein
VDGAVEKFHSAGGRGRGGGGSGRGGCAVGEIGREDPEMKKKERRGGWRGRGSGR